MKSCCVPLCENDTYNRPDLKYFPLPKKVKARKEWLEVLGIKGEYRSQEISICQIHFRDVDFRAGRKELKVHAVPVLCLQKGIIDHIGGEDEVTPEEPEVPVGMINVEQNEAKLEVPNGMIKEEQNEAKLPSAKKRQKADDIVIKQEAEVEMEPETGRRPSRRAALVAARKISSTARQCDVKEDPEDPTLYPTNSTPKTPTNSTPKTPSSSRKSRGVIVKEDEVELDLEMTCEEEELSSVQCTYLGLAQDDYNLTLKNMRDLAAGNVKITQPGDKSKHLDLNSPIINFFAPDGTLLKAPEDEVKSTPISCTKKVSVLKEGFEKSTKYNIPIIYL